MEEVDRGHCATGHHVHPIFDLKKHHVYRIGAFKFITVVRDPLNRVVSEFYWWKRSPFEKAWDLPLHMASSKGLMVWALSPHNNAHNRMTKQIAFFPSLRAPSSKDCASYSAAVEKRYWSALYGRSVDDGLWAAVNQDDELVKNAIHSLSDRFAAVAITERMSDSFTVICNMVVREGRQWDSKCGSSVIQAVVGGGAKHLHHHSHGNVSVEERARLQQLNRLDVELYRFAVGRLDEQLALGRGR
jgi:hypothetical protein